MPLTSLALNGQDVGGLTFVSDLPHLTHLDLTGSRNIDLTRLRGLKLTSLSLQATGVRDLSPLGDLPLQNLNLESCGQLSDLGPLSKASALERLDIGRTGVRKLSPLAGLKLKSIQLTPDQFPAVELEVLREMTSLQEIAGSPAKQFWQKHDARKRDR